MAEIAIALREVFQMEGIYSNDPTDPGQETVYGCSRKFWPNEPFWSSVDKIKAENPGNDKKWKELISNSETIKSGINSFYRREFWDSFHLDEMPQNIANEIFEQSVNIGIKQCTLHIQRTLNLLNKDASLWKDTAEDGKFGNETYSLLKKGLDYDAFCVLGTLNLFQGKFYIELKKEKYIRGWLNNRVFSPSCMRK